MTNEEKGGQLPGDRQGDAEATFREMSQNPLAPARGYLPGRGQRAVILGGILAVVVAAAMCLPPSRLFIVGTVSGDRFFGGWPTRYWAARLQYGDSKVVDRLAQGGKDAVPVLVELLDSSNDNMRRAAAEAISRIATDTEEAGPSLAKALRDEDLSVRVAAIPLNMGVAARNKEVLGHLLELAQSISTPEDEGAYAKKAAKVASALASFGPEAKAAVPTMENWLPLREREQYETIHNALRAIDLVAADRIILPDGWEREMNRMDFFDGDSSLIGVRAERFSHGGELRSVTKGKWEAQPEPRDGLKNFAAASQDRRRMIALWYALSATADGAWLVGPSASSASELKKKCFLAREGGTSSVHLIHGTTGEMQTEDARPPQVREGTVFAQVFSPVGLDLALGVSVKRDGSSAPYQVLIVDIGKKEVRARMQTWVRPTFLAYAHDGSRIAVASDRGPGVDVFETATGRRLKSIEIESQGVRPVFCNQSKWVTTLSGKHPNAISLWDAATGKLVKELKWHRNRITALAVSSDGRRLASCDSLGWIRIWNVQDLMTATNH
jgi:hypothetical protein